MANNFYENDKYLGWMFNIVNVVYVILEICVVIGVFVMFFSNLAGPGFLLLIFGSAAVAFAYITNMLSLTTMKDIKTIRDKMHTGVVTVATQAVEQKTATTAPRNTNSQIFTPQQPQSTDKYLLALRNAVDNKIISNEKYIELRGEYLAKEKKD